MHVWGVGMTPEERDLGKAYFYFTQATPGGIQECSDRLRKKKKANTKDSEEPKAICDRHSINGLGIINLMGIEGLVERNTGQALRWFELAKDMGDPEGMYNYAMLRLGWMVSELEDITSNSLSRPKPTATFKLHSSKTKEISSPAELSYMALRRDQQKPNIEKYTGPSVSDYNVAVQELTNAASKGHLQAKHKLGILYATGAKAPQQVGGRLTKALSQSCTHAVKYFKSVADNGHTISRRNRAAWKQYNAGDYESALRNYLAAAETGNEVGQVSNHVNYCMLH